MAKEWACRLKKRQTNIGKKPCKSEIFKKTAAAAVKAVLLCNGVKWAFAGGKKEKNLVCAEKNASKRSKV